MAVKVSGLPNSSDFNGQEQVLVVQGGVSKQGSLSAFTPYLSGELVTYNKLDDLSVDWESTYTTVSSNSASWDAHTDPYDDSWLISPSANWESTYTTVSANSAVWFNDGVGGTIQGSGVSWVDDDALLENTLNIRATNEGVVTGLYRGEGSVDLQTSRETETQVASGTNSVIAGGKSNQANGAQDVIGGGYNNATIDPLGFNNVIGGGSNNYIIGYDNVIPGGANNNIQANKSFAAGSNAAAVHDGVVIFGDSQNSVFTSTNTDSFNVRAQGGFRLVDGYEAAGKVLTCVDGEGTSRWTDPEVGISYDDSLLQAASGGWDSTYTTVSSNSASWVGGGGSVTPQVILANGVQILVWDHALGSTIKHTLTDDVFSISISNVVDGDSGLIILRQDGLGPWTYQGSGAVGGGAASQRILAGDLASIATVLPGEVITLGWFYDGQDNQIYYYVSDID